MNLSILFLLGVVGLAIYGGYHLTKHTGRVLSARRLRRQQEQEDELTFWEYDTKRRAIRDRFDPNSEWNEATSVPAEYANEIRELNFRYRQMLERRNGWTAKDFTK